ncbi:TM2 domain-containing protein [Lutibacter sp. Hel_I_33_5]|uniref:TM2 domain-containing protein n=1 Tax=Lutibacter sp. Hel_I_33_5 TaxID=1566289 RepID=UPI0011A6DEAB|nr:TM2 domain-containing protein [Lutibacter sp. Hel_I_33_5]TVZ56393.1 TM2 domain-containing protein [Lutibacter sp. Hel_I_33_5]
MNVIDENGKVIPNQESKRIITGVLGILLGWAGVHKFVLGYTNEGLIMLAGTFVLGCISLGVLSGAVGLIGLIEGIIYLTKSDDEFIETYQNNKKPWF